jgi:hypothetical protein
LQGLLEELLQLAAESNVVSRKVCQSLKSAGLHDRAAILQVALSRGCGALAFRSGEAKPRNHECKMPAQLDLLGFGEQPEEFRLVAVQEPGFLYRNFFSGIGRAHSLNWILAPEALDELWKTARFSKNEPSHFVRASDGAPVRAFQHDGNFSPRHFRKRRLTKI